MQGHEDFGKKLSKKLKKLKKFLGPEDSCEVVWEDVKEPHCAIQHEKVCEDTVKEKCKTEFEKLCKGDLVKQCKTDFTTQCIPEIKEDCKQWQARF